MPRSKKGRISGAARKELNARRAGDAVSGRADGITFARVTKMTGSGHCRVAVQGKFGPKELHARIPNVLGRRGATPITTKDVVSIYVGPDFNPNEDPIGSTAHFDITSILTQKQAYVLMKAGEIPEWMTHDANPDAGSGTAADTGGFEFDHGDAAADVEDDESDTSSDGIGFRRKPAVTSTADADLDIDEI